jgi:hypothetical protein
MNFGFAVERSVAGRSFVGSWIAGAITMSVRREKFFCNTCGQQVNEVQFELFEAVEKQPLLHDFAIGFVVGAVATILVFLLGFVMGAL